jgi:hypothetical protein
LEPKETLQNQKMREDFVAEEVEVDNNINQSCLDKTT